MATLDELLAQPVPERSLDDLLASPAPEPPSTGQGFWRSLIEDPEEKIPFAGGVMKAGRFIGVIEAAQRLQSDFDYSKLTGQARAKAGLIGWVPSQARKTTKEADVKLVEEYLREANKKYTGLGQVGRTVGEMPAFMVEFLATGGLKKLGERGATRVAEKLLKGQAERTLTRAGVGLGKYMSGAALRSAGLPQRAAVSVLKRQLPKGISYGPNGEINIKSSGEKPFTSIIKGLGDHYIEILSEQAGEIVVPAMGRALKKTPFLGNVLTRMQTKWLKLHKSKTAVDFLNKIGTKAGFNGVATELGEEFYGDQLRAIFDVEDFGAGETAGMLERMSAALDNDVRNLPVMAAAFAIPGVGRAALGFAIDPKAPAPSVGKTVTLYHGSPTSGIKTLRPGQPAQNDYMPPREGVVYLARSEEIVVGASNAQSVYSAQVDESKLVPDEDSVFTILSNHRADELPTLTKKIHDLWKEYSGRSWEDYITNQQAGTEAPPPLDLELSLEINSFTDWIEANHPDAAKEIVKNSGTVGYRGELPVVETNAISEPTHQWSKEEIDTTFGPGISEALERVQAGEASIDEVVEMSELQELEERKIQGLPTVTEQGISADEFESLVSTRATEYMKDGMPQERAWDWARKVIASELDDELGTNQIIEESPVDVTPEESKIEFYEQKRLEAPKTTVVKELAKLVSTGLTIDEAVATLQAIRTSKTQEITHKDQMHLEVAEIVEGLKHINPAAFNNEVIGTRESRPKEFKEAIKDSITHYHWGHIRVGRMLEWLDGRSDGPLKEFIWKPIRAAVAQSALGRSYRMKQLHDYLDELGLDVKEMYNTRIEIREGLTLRPVDLLEIFLATKDKEKLSNLKAGNKFSEEDIQDSLAALIQDERMIRLGHWLLHQYSADYTEMAEKHFKTTGNTLPKIPGYSAIRRMPESKFARFVKADQEFDDLLPQLMGVKTFGKKGVPKSMTLKRTKAIGPLNLDALANYVAHARAVEHYKAMAIPVFNVNQMINDNEFRQVVHKKTRGVGNDILSKWVQDVASERTTLENSWLSHTLGVLRRNAVVSSLGLNVITALKQPLSLSLAAAENPRMIPGIIRAFAEGATSPSALKKFVHDRSVVVRHRNMEREIRELSRRKSVRKQISGKRALSEKALVLIRMMDQATVQVVWKAAYDMASQQETEEQAISYADSVVERTQPMADIMDLPHFYRGSELAKMLTLFQNQINQNYNYWAHDVVGAKRRGELSNAMVSYRVLMSTLLPAAFLGLISRGFTPGDPEQWGKDMASFMLAPAFMFGRIASAVLNGYDPASMVGFGWAKELYDASRSKSPGTVAVHMLGAGAKAGGIPWSQPKRSVKGLIELNNLEADDPRRLIWSQYALGDDKGGSTPLRRRRRVRRARRAR